MPYTKEEARRRKNDRQREYSRRTNHEAQNRYKEKNRDALKQLSYYLPAELAEKYKTKCKEDGISLSEIPLKAIKEYLSD